MALSRRQWLAGSALVSPLAPHAQPSSSTYLQFNPTIANAALRHTVAAVNAMAQIPIRDRRPYAATHAMAELLFAHFEETGFSTMLDQHLDQLVPLVEAQAAELAATVRDYGMRVPEDLFSRIATPDATATAHAWQMEWSGLRRLLLRGLAVGMTTLTEPMKMYVRATWEPPRPRIVRTPLLLKDAQLAEELPRVQAAGEVAIHLGVVLDGLAGTKTKEAEAPAGAAQMASIGGMAVIGIGVAVYLICLHTKKRLASSV
jgi:hypothetical protein